MVKHTNAERVDGLFQASRDLLVFRVWRRVAARVIVHENYGSRAKVQGCPPDFAGMALGVSPDICYSRQRKQRHQQLSLALY